jgi:hypothetical protein
MNKYLTFCDIYGILSKLGALLQITPIKQGQDTIVFLGDYLDREGQHPKVIERIINLRVDGFRVVEKNV